VARSTKSKRRPPKKTGRPSVYDAVTCTATARKLRGEGKTFEDIARALGVARSTFDEWRTLHPEFSAALEAGDEDADIRVERALFERAVGYKHPETKLMTVSRPGGMGQSGGSMVERHEVTAHYPPDTAAAKFWLTNRRRKLWSDKQKIEHEGTLTLEQMLKESWAKAEEKKEGECEQPPK
jgi:hypothetical protein